MLFTEKNLNNRPFTTIDRPEPGRGYLGGQIKLILDQAGSKFLRLAVFVVLLVLGASPILIPFIKKSESVLLFFPFLTLAAGLLIFLFLSRALLLKKDFYWRKGILNIFLLAALAVILAAGWQEDFGYFSGLRLSSSGPQLLLYGLAVVGWLLLYNWRGVGQDFVRKIFVEGTGEKFARRLVKIYFWASSVAGAGVLLAALLAGRLETTLSIFLPVFVFNLWLYFLLAWQSQGPAKKFFILAGAVHFILVLLSRDNFAWLALAIAFFALLFCQAFFQTKRKLLYPLLAALAALLLFFVNLFWQNSPFDIVQSSFSARENWQILSANFREADLLEKLVGPARSQGQAFWSANFIETATWEGIDQTAPRLGSGIWLGPFSLGAVGLLAWLLTIGYLFYKSLGFISQKNFWQRAIFLGYVLVLLEFFFLPWTLPFFWLFVFSSSLIIVLSPETEGKTLKIAQNKFWPWFRRSGLVILSLLFLISSFVAARLVLGAIFEEAAFYALKPEARERNLGRAAKVNPWNEEYKINLARHKLIAVADYTNVVEQKSALEEVSKTARALTEKSSSGLVLWQTASLYKDFEVYALGSALLARQTYLQALALLPKNLALRQEIVQFYRENFSKLASADLAPDALFAEARSILEDGLALDPNRLSLRTELAFIVEQQEGIPAALAILEPWEEASIEIKFHIGRLHYNDGNYRLAEEKFTQITRIDPNYSNAHYSLGLVYFRQNRLTDSLAEFGAVLNLNPGNKDVEEKIQAIKEALAGQAEPAAPEAETE